ncbi:hybrid sensor histidine kinase/response regulator [bacterium]|nr:MAG: hybrid sensor histidine kinase/response regulator [bacterium]
MDASIRLLLVDDDPEDALFARRALAEPAGPAGGFDVSEAASLAGALALLAREPFDIVYLDLSLPDARGLATLKALRDAAPATPVVVVTGHGDERLGAEAVRRGAQDYLVKGSVSPADLRRAALYAVTRARLSCQALAIERLGAEVEERRRQADLKDRFFATAAHEVRSPVTVVRAALQMLQEGGAGELNAEQRFMVDMGLRNVLNLARQLDDFLELSRLDAGAAKADPADFDPAPALSEAAHGFGLVGARRGVTVELAAPASLPAARADPAMFRRILANLLDNALRFARSRVSVGARPLASGTLEFWVEDDGPGIPPERLPNLFQRFSQADRAAADDGYRGTGLGLALCKEMVELNGGALEASAASGSGTRFCFRLPGAGTASAARTRAL